MYYQVVSFSHKNCELAMREKLAFANHEEMKVILDQLTHFEFIHEAFIISTCNRVEIVLATRDNFASYHAVLGLMSQKSTLSFYELKSTAKRYDDEEAIRHIFSVVSSLDSLVVGESQITGQVKDAFRFSFQNGTAGKRLNRVISHAVKCAAQVRNATNISQNPISIASVAVAQAHKLLGDNIQGMKGIVVGAGEMSEIVAKHLVANGCNVIIFNRSVENARNIASAIGERIDIESFNALSEYINRYRLLFSATGAPYAVITEEMVKPASFKRHWFDLAVPRDIEDISDPTVNVYAVDDLKEIVDTNLALRKEQARKAYEIVGRYTIEFFKWLQTLMIDPLIKDLREQARQAAMAEIERAVKKGFISSDIQKNVEKIVHNAFNKFLHTPTKQLRDVAEQPRADTIIEAMKYIFKTDAEVNMVDKYRCEFVMKDDIR